MKRLLALLFAGLFSTTTHAEETMHTAYDFTLEAIDGSPMPLTDYKGKVVLVVNTASQCGFTPQYEGLEKLYQSYKDQGLVVLGVPSNDFGGQEPGSNKEIAEFCETRFRTTFPMAGKAVVKGKDAIPLYLWLAEATGSSPKWNFHKYLIGRDGAALDYFHSTTAPDASSLKEAIEKALAAPSA